MINHLRKKISVLLVFLFSIIWIELLVLFCNVNYQHNLQTLRSEFSAVLREFQLPYFIRTQGADADFDGVSYAVFSYDKAKRPHLLFHTFADRSEEELLDALQPTDEEWSQHLIPADYTRFSRKSKQTKQRYIILASTDTAVHATMPVFFSCFLIGLGGIGLFFCLARLLSGWLVKPITDMISSEKLFLSNASHELKTPLSVIRANIQLLSDELPEENKHLKYIDLETDRMIALVNQMLTLARLEAPQVQEETHARFSVSDVLLDVIYPMESIAFEKQLTLKTEIPDSITITGNENQIQTLISILLNNALSYTPTHGTISVRADSRNHKFYLSVANTGEPIPEEIAARLFERFFRADEAREDNGHFGLGLSIAQSIVTNHSGKIQMQRSGDQTVFSVVLPS